MTLENDLQRIIDAEKNAGQALEGAEKQSEAIKRNAQETARREEEVALNKTREMMAMKENALVESAQKEGDVILKDAQTSIEKFKVLAEKNKSAASDYLVKEILKQ